MDSREQSYPVMRSAIGPSPTDLAYGVNCNSSDLICHREPGIRTKIGNHSLRAGASVMTFKATVSKGTYLYRVQAFNATSVSAYSNTVTVRVVTN